MKKIALILLVLMLAACGDSGSGAVSTTSTNGEPIYWGDSITALCADSFAGINRATIGDTTIHTLAAATLYHGHDAPTTHRLTIGTNDVATGIDDGYAARLNVILGQLEGHVIFTSILPTRDAAMNAKIRARNEEAKALVLHWGHEYRDMYGAFQDADGLLISELAIDGVHLNQRGCALMFGE